MAAAGGAVAFFTGAGVPGARVASEDSDARNTFMSGTAHSAACSSPVYSRVDPWEGQEKSTVAPRNRISPNA